MLPSDWIEQIRNAYPRRTGGQGWGYVKQQIPKLIHEGNSFEDLLAGVNRYAALMAATNTTNTPYVMQARTFFGPGEWWIEDYDLPSDGSVELTLDEEAKQYGIERQDDESDEHLRRRMGLAMVKKQYAQYR